MEDKIIVTLQNGMHQDNDMSEQPDGTYRDSLNGDILGTETSGRFIWTSYNGNKVSFTIPSHANYKKFQPIGWYSFDDDLITLNASDDDDFPGEIAIVKTNKYGALVSYTPIYFHTGLRLTKEHPIPHDGIVGKPENQNTKRVYFTDNYNSFRSINWKDVRFHTHIGTSSLIVGKKYMVLSKDSTSYITHDTVNYAPGFTDGNIFTATTTTFTLTGANAWVIEYVAIESLDVVPSITFGALECTGYVSGGVLRAATYQYCYRLKTTDGFKTNWSFLSLPIHMVTNVFCDDTHSIGYANHIAIAPGGNTTKGIKLRVKDVDISTYQTLEVAYIAAEAPGAYSLPKIFYSEEVNTTDVDLIHYGNETILAVLTLNDITVPAVSLDRVKTITATKNILFASGLGVAPDPDIDLLDVTAKCIEYLMPSDILGKQIYTNPISAGHGVFGHQATKAAIFYQRILPYQWYEVVTGTVTYDSNSYNTGEMFQGVFGETSYTGGTVVAIIRIQKYSAATNDVSDNWKTIRIENDFCDHKGLLMSHYMKSLWRKEKYRYGIHFYGTKGQKNYTKWLIDKVIPEQWRGSTYEEEISRDKEGGPDTAQVGFSMQLCEYDGTSTEAALRIIGMNFSNLDFNEVATAYGCALEDLHLFVKGFSIVRMERDPQIISQGVLWPNMADGTKTKLCSTTDIGTDDLWDSGDTYKGRRPNSYMYYSPDVLNGYKDSRSITASDKLEITAKYDIIEDCGTGMLISQSAGFYNKYYIIRDDINGTIEANGFQASIRLEGTDLVEHAGLGINFPDDGVDGFDNDGTCATFITLQSGATWGFNSKTYGCDGVHVAPDLDESANPDGLGKCTEGMTHKCLINWIREKNNLYGGDSDTVKATHKYLFCGHYQQLDSAFMAYMTGTADGTVAAPSATKQAGIVNNVEVFGGDAFVSMFGFGRGVVDTDDVPNSMGQGVVIPIESSINENWRGGEQAPQYARTFNRDRFFDATVAPNGMNYPDSDYEESWTFNAVYSGREYQYFLDARPLNFTGIATDENIIRFSLQKIDGEITDNWRVWLYENYKRNDSMYEGTVSIRAKGDKLFYWQKKGVGYMPVFERQLSSNSLGQAVQLGIGGILERFDEIDYWYGLQHQFGLMETENGFVWPDIRRGTMLKIGFNGEKALLSTVKGMEYFMQHTEEGTGLATASYANYLNSDNPLTGKGIFSYYDQNGKRGYMCFRRTETVGNRQIEKNITLVFTELLDKYLAFISFFPNHMINHNGKLFATRKVLRTFKVQTTYAAGDELIDEGTQENYVCILGYTTSDTVQQPSANPTNWRLASSISQVHMNWAGKVCNWFGKDYEAYLGFVVKDRQGQEFTVDNLKVPGNNNPYTDVYTSVLEDPDLISQANGTSDAQDVDIKPYDENYSFFDGAWHFNLPLTNEENRQSSSFLYIKLRVKNWINHPAEANAVVKTIRKIIAYVRLKL